MQNKQHKNGGSYNLLMFFTRRGEPIYLGIEDIENIYRFRQRNGYSKIANLIAEDNCG
jgi:hypothetical protein